MTLRTAHWVFLALLAAAADARAQATGIPADRLVPAIGPASFIAAEGASVTPRGAVSTAFSLDYVSQPLRLSLALGGGAVSQPVRELTALDAALEIGLTRRIAISAGIPLILNQAGDRLRSTGLDDLPLASFTPGDVRLRVKAALVGVSQRRVFHLAALVQFTIPTEGAEQFAGTAGVTVEPRVIADLKLGPVAVVAQLGVRFAEQRKVFMTTFGDELTWIVGGMVPMIRRGPYALVAILESGGFAGESTGTRPVELRAALRGERQQLSLDVGAGGGLNSDAGAPSWRLFAMFRARLGSAQPF